MKNIITLVFLQIFLFCSATAGVVRVHPSARPHGHENIKTKQFDESSGQSSKRKTGEDAREWSGKNEKIKQGKITDHFEKHNSEFSNIKSEKSYVKATKEFINNPPKGTLSKIRSSNGDLILYHPATNTFASVTKSGAIKTMFKPDTSIHGLKTNLDYFYAQN